MPRTYQSVIASGRLREHDQPDLQVDGELGLRPWLDTDAADVRAVYADPSIERWHARTIDTVAEALELIGGWRAGWTAETQASWAVVDAPGALVGRIALTGLDLSEGTGHVAYWTAPFARGRGVAPRAVRTLSAWAFATGFHRLQLEHSTANVVSCRVALKAGFPAEGTQRSAALHADGWHNMHVHARLGPDTA